MNTKTLMTIKTEKSLKVAAQKTAENLGFSLGTLVNAYLRQLVRTKEISFSANYQPSQRLVRSLRGAEKELSSGKLKKFKTVDALMADLRS